MATTSRTRFQLFAHSRWDAAMVGVSVVEIALTAYGTISWGNITPLGSVLIAGVCIVLNCMNYQCIAHSFIHHPFFAQRWLNTAFSVVSSLSLQAPQTLYRAHHLEHHRHNNDRPDPQTGRTKDSSSTYRYARRGAEEHLLSYAFIGPLRVDYGYLYSRSRKRGDAALTWTEALTIAAYMVALGLSNWKGLLLFYVPVWYLGQAFALAHNYCEHHGAIAGNRMTDSVSCYGRWYNWFWFNEGYHQEHHFRPQVHWTRLPELRAQMLPESQRRVVPYAHWMNLFARIPRPARENTDVSGHAA
jgi:fatty acid desaturase